MPAQMFGDVHVPFNMDFIEFQMTFLQRN